MTRFMYLLNDPLILGRSHTSFYLVSAAYTKWPHFPENLNINF